MCNTLKVSSVYTAKTPGGGSVMDKGIKATLCTTCVFAVIFAAVTGCAARYSNSENGMPEDTDTETAVMRASETAKVPAADASEGTSGSQTPVTNRLPVQHYPNAVYISVKEDKDSDLPVNGSVGDYEYTVLSSSDKSVPTQKNRGYYIDSTEEPGAPCCFIICSGQKSTGGYGIRITDLGINGDRLYIVAEETSPAEDAMVTEAIDYPYCVLELDRMPESYDVINTSGLYFSYILEPDMEDEETREILESLRGDSYQVPDGYCAILNGGVGEISYKTYVYCCSSGTDGKQYYEYIHVTSTTVSWGSTVWRNTFDSSGSKSTREEIVETARQHGSGDFMTLPGDYRNVFSIDDFLKMDFVATDGSFT